MNDLIKTLWNHPMRKPVIGGIIGFAGGAVVGYLVGSRPRVVEEYHPDRDRHIAPEKMASVQLDMNEHRHQLKSVENGEFVQSKDPVHSFIEEQITGKTVDEITIDEPQEEEEEPNSPTVPMNIFDRRTDDDDVGELVQVSFVDNNIEWDYAVELKNRNGSLPYIIHRDEHYANESGFKQVTVVYYEGDNTLIDEDENPVYNWSSVLGELKFGHGSGDPNIVFIRNSNIRCEYEVVREMDSYERAKQGLTDMGDEREKHPVPRFRRE